MVREPCGDTLAVRERFASVEFVCDRPAGHDGPHQCDGGPRWERVRPGAAWGAYGALDSRPFHGAGSTYQPRGMRD